MHEVTKVNVVYGPFKWLQGESPRSCLDINALFKDTIAESLARTEDTSILNVITFNFIKKQYTGAVSAYHLIQTFISI